MSFYSLFCCCVTEDDYYEDDEEDDPDALKDPIYQVDLQVRPLVEVPLIWFVSSNSIQIQIGNNIVCKT